MNDKKLRKVKLSKFAKVDKNVLAYRATNQTFKEKKAFSEVKGSVCVM